MPGYVGETAHELTQRWQDMSHSQPINLLLGFSRVHCQFWYPSHDAAREWIAEPLCCLVYHPGNCRLQLLPLVTSPGQHHGLRHVCPRPWTLLQTISHPQRRMVYGGHTRPQIPNPVIVIVQIGLIDCKVRIEFASLIEPLTLH